MSRVVRIAVRGRLSARFGTALDGFAVEVGQGETAFVGQIRDGSQLRDLLDVIADFGLELVRVEELDP